jgi:hypothetical protein
MVVAIQVIILLAYTHGPIKFMAFSKVTAAGFYVQLSVVLVLDLALRGNKIGI